MARPRGVNPDRDTWNAKLPMPLRARIDAIWERMEADKGRTVLLPEVLEYLIEQEEARQP